MAYRHIHARSLSVARSTESQSFSGECRLKRLVWAAPRGRPSLHTSAFQREGRPRKAARTGGHKTFSSDLAFVFFLARGFISLPIRRDLLALDGSVRADRRVDLARAGQAAHRDRAFGRAPSID